MTSTTTNAIAITTKTASEIEPHTLEARIRQHPTARLPGWFEVDRIESKRNRGVGFDAYGGLCHEWRTVRTSKMAHREGAYRRWAHLTIRVARNPGDPDIWNVSLGEAERHAIDARLDRVNLSVGQINAVFALEAESARKIPAFDERLRQELEGHLDAIMAAARKVYAEACEKSAREARRYEVLEVVQRQYAALVMENDDDARKAIDFAGRMDALYEDLAKARADMMAARAEIQTPEAYLAAARDFEAKGGQDTGIDEESAALVVKLTRARGGDTRTGVTMDDLWPDGE